MCTERLFLFVGLYKYYIPADLDLYKIDFDVDVHANLMASYKIQVNLCNSSLICLALLEMEFDSRYLVCCIKTHKLVFMRYCQDLFCGIPHLH